MKQPLLLMPTANDPDNVKEGGELVAALQANNAESATSADFLDVQHGFSVRGDVSDPKVK